MWVYVCVSAYDRETGREKTSKRLPLGLLLSYESTTIERHIDTTTILFGAKQ